MAQITSDSIALPSVYDFLRQAEQSSEYPTYDPLNILFLRNCTIEGIEPFLKYHAYGASICPMVSFGGFNTIHQDVLKDGFDDEVDVLVLSLLLDSFVPAYGTAEREADSPEERLTALFDTVNQRTGSLVLVNSFLPAMADPDTPECGALVSRLNARVRSYVSDHASRFVLIDWERTLMRLGVDLALDRRFWYLSRAPFKPAFLSQVAKEIVSVGRSLKGKSKKCVVLDCDDTLWGGVVGESGRDGIQLDPHDYPGRVYYDFQSAILQLESRGVLVALCSKNDEGVVWDVLDNHPHCLLRREHISAHRINWEDKPDNLRALSTELNIGLDSFVFVDDSPFERGMVSELLPEVTVLDRPAKLVDYPSIVEKAKSLFSPLAVTREDKTRSRMLQDESVRRQASATFTSVAAFLESLELKAVVHQLVQNEIPRVSQLSQRTNQFNLTSRRYSEEEIRHFSDRADARVFTLGVSDRFGDQGLTGILIALKEQSAVKVDTLLLSCRVLGRRLADFFAGHCIRQLIDEWDPALIEAEFVPNGKNDLVSDFWDHRGFAIASSRNGSRLYRATPDSISFGEVHHVHILTGES